MIFAAAILRKLGETSIELTSEDIAAVPLDRVSFSVGAGDIVTIRIDPEPNPDQGELPLAAEPMNSRVKQEYRDHGHDL